MTRMSAPASLVEKLGWTGWEEEEYIHLCPPVGPQDPCTHGSPWHSSWEGDQTDWTWRKEVISANTANTAENFRPKPQHWVQRRMGGRVGRTPVRSASEPEQL